MSLLPLPEAFPAGYIAQTEHFYTANQMIAYSKQCAESEREACAKVCHDVQMGTYLHQSNDYYDGENEGAKKCWQRIRARNES